MNYYTSDLHFGHENIIKFCNRPWTKIDINGNTVPDVESMDEGLINNWNIRINDDDHVYILGDFCFNKTHFIELLGKLKGFKHFVLGNHDPKGIIHAAKHLKNVFFHDLIHTVKDGNKKIVLCHYPIREWNGYYRGVVHFHGHTHGTIGDNFHDNAFDVGVDSRDYEPKLYEEIVADKFVHRNLGIIIIISFIIAVISVTIISGAVGLLFTTVGLAVIIMAVLYIWINNNINKADKNQ